MALFILPLFSFVSKIPELKSYNTFLVQMGLREAFMRSGYISRRQFLAATSSLVSTLGVRSSYSLANELKAGGLDIEASQRIFAHGVASGDPLEDSVIVWTRVSGASDESIAIRWQLALDSDFDQIIYDEWQQCYRSNDYTFKVDVGELEASTSYYYRFYALNHWSMIGRTKTAPSSTDDIKIAFCSCSSIWSGYMLSYSRIAQRDDLDLVIHCGDYIYEIPDPDEKNIMPYDIEDEIKPTSLERMRRRYAYYRRNIDLRRAHQQHPFSIIWDNHDIDIDGDKNDALRAFFEWTPIREPKKDDYNYIYRRLRYGTLLDIFLLDTRHIGRDSLIPDSQDKSILGEQQYKWLCSELSKSQAKWKLLANQVIFSTFTAFGQPLSKAHWEGYREDRRRLLEFVSKNQISNLVIASGDAHMFIASEFSLDDKPLGVEFLSGSISRGNINETIAGILGKVASSVVDKSLPLFNPNIRFLNTKDHGYGILDFKQDKLTAEFWSQTIDNLSQNQSLLASFEVMENTNQIRQIKNPKAIADGNLARPAPWELRVYERSKLFGGEWGEYFDHELGLELDDAFFKLNIRSGERLDALGFFYKQKSKRFLDGGSGGLEESLELNRGEYVVEAFAEPVRVGLKWQIGYLSLKTNFGREFSGGVLRRQARSYDIPKGWCIWGAYGRKAKEINALGFLIRRIPNQ